MMARENFFGGIGRSRRNLIKVGAIAGAAVLATLTTPRLATAGHGQGGNGQGGNGQGGNGQGGNGQCFLKGTNIRTVEGDKKVEDLSRGDLLPTVFGGICPVQWIGRYSLKKSDPTKAWSKKCCQFGSFDRPLVSMFRVPICMSRRSTHCSSKASW